MRNGPVTHKTEGFAKQLQVMIIGKLFFEDVPAGDSPVSIKLDQLRSRFSFRDFVCNKEFSSFQESVGCV